MRTRLASLAAAALLALAVPLVLGATTPALADPGPGGDSGPTHHDSSGPGSGHGGNGSDDGGSASGGSRSGDDHTDADAQRATLPVGSVADGRSGVAGLSTPPDPAAGAAARAGLSAGTGAEPRTVVVVMGAVLLLAGMVAAGFRARGRLGRLG